MEKGALEDWEAVPSATIAEVRVLMKPFLKLWNVSVQPTKQDSNDLKVVERYLQKQYYNYTSYSVSECTGVDGRDPSGLRISISVSLKKWNSGPMDRDTIPA